MKLTFQINCCFIFPRMQHTTQKLEALVGPIMFSRPNRVVYPDLSTGVPQKRNKYTTLPADTLTKCGVFGRGTYARVFRVNAPGVDYDLAFKEFRDPESQSAIRELYVMTALSHPCIIAPYCVVTDPRHRICGYLMQQATTTLAHFADCCPSPQKRPLQISLLMRAFTEDLVEGLRYLHNSGFLHRDIKPDNILIIDGIAKLADLGLATVADEACLNTGTVQTHHFRAPELWKSCDFEQVVYGTEVDVYALGVTLLDLFLGDKRASRLGDFYSELVFIEQPSHCLQKIALFFEFQDDSNDCPSPYFRLEKALVVGMVRLRSSERITMDKAITMIRGPVIPVDKRPTTQKDHRLTAEQESTLADIDLDYETTKRSNALAKTIVIECGGNTDKHVDGSLNIAFAITDYDSPELDRSGHDVLHLLICGGKHKRRRGIKKCPRISAKLTSKMHQKETNRTAHVARQMNKGARKGRHGVVRVRVRE